MYRVGFNIEEDVLRKPPVTQVGFGRPCSSVVSSIVKIKQFSRRLPTLTFVTLCFAFKNRKIKFYGFLKFFAVFRGISE